MRLRTAALAATAIAAPAASADTPAQSIGHAIKVHRRCQRTFTARMFERAARAVYHGTGLPHRGAYGHLWRYARCQRPPSSERHARVLWHRQLVAWADRRRARFVGSMSTGVASWYEDGGSTASGFHAFYGVANRALSFGTRVLFCYPAGSSRCVTATVDDRGPFVAGRDWDLNQNTAGALGFSGVDTVAYRVR